MLESGRPIAHIVKALASENRELRKPVSGSLRAPRATLPLGGSLVVRTRSAFDVIPPPALVLLGIVSVQVGSALAKHLFDEVGSFGTVALRLFFAAAVLMLLWRPSLALLVDRDAWPVVLGYGVILGLMNLSFYLALDRLPLGIAVTIEFLGPLAVALLGSRRWLDAFWAVLAAGGVVLLMEGGGDLDLVGVLFALAAGVFWGLYILLGAALGRHTTEGNGLALGMVIAALIAVPFGVADAGTALLEPWVLFAGPRRGVLVLRDPVHAGPRSAPPDARARVRHPHEPRTRDGRADRPHRPLRVPALVAVDRGALRRHRLGRRHPQRRAVPRRSRCALVTTRRSSAPSVADCTDRVDRARPVAERGRRAGRPSGPAARGSGPPPRRAPRHARESTA